MCNASIQLTNVVENEVLQRMQAKDCFTALDVSNALKTAKYLVRHREVAEVVRDIYNSGAMQHYDYDRRLIKVTTDGGANSAEAYLYHHHSARVEDYAATNQDALPPVPGDQARDLSDCVAADPLGLFTRVPATGARNQSSRRHIHGSSRRAGGRSLPVRRDGALPIPRRIIAQLGWTDGDALTVRPEGGRIVVETAAGATGMPGSPAALPGASARVWGGQRVRICKTKLSLGALAADAVTVSIDSHSLCIAPLP